MKCNLCGKDNEPENLFCIHCGAPLVPLRRQLDAFNQELRRISGALAFMNDRLTALERAQTAQAPLAESDKGVAGPPISPIGAVSTELPTPSVEVWVSPTAGETTPPAVARPARSVPVPSPARVKTGPAKPKEWEQVLGGNWLARIGVITLILGVAFFLKFAYDNNWPAPFVIACVVFGLAMGAVGHYWRNKYRVFAQAITGGGIAILYVSVFAAFMAFGLIGTVPALLLVLAISVGSAVLATKYDSMALAILGIVGAFIAPALVGVGTSGDPAAAAQHGTQLLPYVLAVDVGVLVLSAFRNWRWFTLLSLTGSLIFFLVWFGLGGDRLGLLAAEGGLTLIFLVFVAATTFFHIVRRRPVRGHDYALAAVNATAYFILSYVIMWSDLRAWLGGFSLLVALFYGALAYAAFRRTADKTLGLFTLGIAIIVVTTAIPVQLGDIAWTTIAWAAQAAVLVWLSVRTGLAHFRIYAYLAFGLVMIRLLAFDTWMTPHTLVFNERVLAFLFSGAAMYVSSYLLWRARVDRPRAVHSVMLVAGSFCLWWMMAVELADYSSTRLPTVGNSLSLLLLLGLATVMTWHHLVWKRTTSTVDVVLVAVNAAITAGLSVFLWGHLRTWMGLLYFVLAAVNGVLAYAVIRRGERNALFTRCVLAIPFAFLAVAVPVQFRNEVWTTIGWAVLATSSVWLFLRTRIPDFRVCAGISIGLLTVAIPLHFGNQAWTTVAWAGELAMLAWLSFTLRLSEFRYYSYVVFVAIFGQLLVFRTGVNIREYDPIVNGRFLVYLVGIAAAYVSAYLLWRGRKAYPQWATPASTLVVGANFLTLWLLSFEVWDFFESRQAGALVTTGRSAQYLSLTALWAVYAIILIVVGIWRRLRPVRLAGLGLLAIPILKLFFFDVWVLVTVYRILAFVGLGLLLLVSAYLYQRYSKAIRGFILNKG